MYNSDHAATECIGQKKNFLLPPQSVDVLSRFIYTALWPYSCQWSGNLAIWQVDQLFLRQSLAYSPSIAQPISGASPINLFLV